MHRATEALPLGHMDRLIKFGDALPPFALRTPSTGSTLVAISRPRGRWFLRFREQLIVPLQRELYALQHVTGTLKELSATLCAITPSLRIFNRQLIERHKLGFDLLSDHRNEDAAALGLRLDLPDELKQVYLSSASTRRAHGEDSWTLPMPGRFVIDRKGIRAAVRCRSRLSLPARAGNRWLT